MPEITLRWVAVVPPMSTPPVLARLMPRDVEPEAAEAALPALLRPIQLPWITWLLPPEMSIAWPGQRLTIQPRSVTLPALSCRQLPPVLLPLSCSTGLAVQPGWVCASITIEVDKVGKALAGAMVAKPPLK